MLSEFRPTMQVHIVHAIFIGSIMAGYWHAAGLGGCDAPPDDSCHEVMNDDRSRHGRRGLQGQVSLICNNQGRRNGDHFEIRLQTAALKKKRTTAWLR
jgi:hypothetical protein